MRVYTINRPPSTTAVVAKVVEYDLSMFANPVPLHPSVGRITLLDSGFDVTPTQPGHHHTLEGVYKYAIEFADGTRARASYPEVQVVLTTCGQALLR